jgi:hypothetical protein
MAGDSSRAAGVDNTSRKTWDKAEFHRKAQEREAKDKEVEESKLDARARKRRERDPLHQGIIVARGKIKSRDREIDLAANLGRSYVCLALSEHGRPYRTLRSLVRSSNMSQANGSRS